ncbi:TPA: hypothetical protein ACS72K_003918 [Providencia alcalifaciens]
MIKWREWANALVGSGAAIGVGVSMAMAAETYLPAQDITFGGQIGLPACVVTLASDELTLKAEGGAATQKQSLHLTQCDVEGVEVSFRAHTWPAKSHWGQLKAPGSETTVSPPWHYRLSPVTTASPAEVQLLTRDDLVEDSGLPGSDSGGRGHYFRLDGTRYVYGVTPVSGLAEYVIAFKVSLHHPEADCVQAEGLLSGGFSLQLTYR